jgi:thioredoxin-related protein
MAVAIVLVFVLNRPVPVPEGWHTDYAAAVEEASRTDRNLLVAFAMRGCAPCASMDRSVLPSAAVTSALDRFVPVHVDLVSQRSLADRYDVFAAPTYAVIDPQGELLARCEGYKSVDQFVAFLDSASSKLPPMLSAGVQRPADDG